jgi:hypothetical protein
MNIDNIKNWQAETDKYKILYYRTIKDKKYKTKEGNLLEFVVATNKQYRHGKETGSPYQVFIITEKLIKQESEEKIIKILSILMDHEIEDLIATGMKEIE